MLEQGYKLKWSEKDDLGWSFQGLLKVHALELCSRCPASPDLSCYRNLTQLRRVLPFYVTTHQQRADGFTKPLDKSSFLKWSSFVVHS